MSDKGTDLSVGRYALFNQFAIGGYDVGFGLTCKELVEMLLKGFKDKYGIMLAQGRDQRKEQIVGGKSLDDYRNGLAGIITLYPIANGSLMGRNLLDGLQTEHIVNL